MGDSRSAIYDDEKDYHNLCREIGITPRELYSAHYYWVEDVFYRKSTISYEEYLREQERKALESELLSIPNMILKLQDRQVEITKKLAEL